MKPIVRSTGGSTLLQSADQPSGDWGNAKVDEPSRGMQQKVQFIGTLLHDPQLIILDEPFGGLANPINAGRACKETILEAPTARAHGDLSARI